jgi:hypothetical protein
MSFTSSGDIMTIHHYRNHTHQPHHPIHPTAKQTVQAITQNAAEATPRQLQVGTASREPVTSHHPAFLNVSYLPTYVMKHSR